jgi:hypothetical protein
MDEDKDQAGYRVSSILNIPIYISLFESQGKERTFRAIKERSEFRRRRIGFLVFRRWRRIATIMFTRWTKMVPLP